jgi:hypothetical protein
MLVTHPLHLNPCLDWRQLKEAIRDTVDEDEAFYQFQNYQQSQQLYQAWYKTRIGIEGNQFPNPRT